MYEKFIDPWVTEYPAPPQPPEPLRYMVRSRRGKSPYLVDLAENGFLGNCPCWDFRDRFGKHKAEGRPPLECKMCFHLRKAWRVFRINVARQIIYKLENPDVPVTKVGRDYFLKKVL